ncbi:MAG: hypothetical protein ABEK16_06665 [Candidatus Nanohalobium sp.]
MDEILDILLEFLGLEDLMDIGIGAVIILTGLILAAAGYFLDFSFVDEIAILVGILTVLGGIGYTAYGVLLG